MGKQVEFKLKEINTKESMKDGIEDETRSFKYTNDLHGVELKVKGEANADNLGLPTITLDDSILLEFGPKQVQQKIEETIYKPDGEMPKKKAGRPKKK